MAGISTGRPRKPTALKLIQGTYQPCRDAGDEPQPPAGSLDPPRDLGGEALAQWQHLAPLLLQIHVFTEADRNALARYCTLQAQFILIKKKVQRKPELIDTLLKLNVQLKSLEVEYGLTPASRSRIHAKPVEKDDGEAKKEKRFFG